MEEEDLVVEEGVDYSYRETEWYVDARLAARYSGVPFVEPVEPKPVPWDVSDKGVISLMWNTEMNDNITKDQKRSGGFDPYT